MRIYIDPTRAPLRGVSANMQERRLKDKLKELSDRGIEFIGGQGSYIEVNLRNLAEANGTAQRGQAVLMSTLDEIGCDRIDVSPGDVQYLYGNRDVMSHAVARGLESDIPAIKDALTNIAPDELYDNLDKSSAFIYQDATGSPELTEYLKAGAEADLRQQGLISGDTTNPYAFLEPPVEKEPAPGPWETSPLDYKSPFDRDEFNVRTPSLD